MSTAAAQSWALGLGSGLLSLVLAYLVWGLPRLTRRAAVWATATATVALTAAAIWTPAPLALALAAGAVALAAGHVGFAAGRRPAKAARSVSRPRSERPARAASPHQPRAPQPPAPPTGKPERAMLGRYRIEREIGRGAMGALYLGLDPKIGRQVAIKTMALSQEFEGDALAEARQRFFREAETAGRLQHPDIVTIFDAGEDHGLAYIAMELLRGEDLQSHTQLGKLLPPDVAVRAVARVAEALAYAHSQGVVHRDIKPANVMLDLATEAVKVTDFGIARITDSSRTRTGLVLGTPSFMSPEQMSGRRVDGRSDLYSLGVMLFQLLTGVLPHRSESMATLMHQIANDPAPDVRTLNPELPAALAQVVAKALEKQPERRYADGRQMAAELRAVLPLLRDLDTSAARVSVGPLPPDSGVFEATVKLDRGDPGHNS